MRIALAAITVVAVGCGVTAGRAGELGARYDVRDALVAPTLKAPVAAGEEVDLVVLAPEDPDVEPDLVVFDERRFSSDEVDPVPIEHARSASPGVLEVVSVEQSRIRVRGVAAGEADLELRAGGREDVFRVRVGAVHRAELDHWTWTDDGDGPGDHVLLHGGTASFEVVRRDEAGRRLVGYGAAADVAVTPDGAATVLEGEAEAFHVRIEVGQAERVRLEPTGGEAVAMEIVDPEAVASLSVGSFAKAILRVDARLADGRRALGLDGIARVDSVTPQVCEVAPLSGPLGDGAYALEARDSGVCRVAARLGEHEDTLTMQIQDS